MQTPREELAVVQEEIDRLNAQKQPWADHWESLKRDDPLEPKPAELRALNVRLATWYQQKETILENHPELAAEFGGRRGKRRQELRGFSPPSQQSRTARDRQIRKREIHPQFKSWCAAQRPQVKCSLENWEDALVRARFNESIAPIEAAEEERRKEHIRKEEQRLKKQRKLDDLLAEIPPTFDTFLKDVGSASALHDEGQLLAVWQDKDTRELYDLWLEERTDLPPEEQSEESAAA
ncbi:MAG: hypothetical protein ABIG71_00370 [Candidatus Uhrbacteria bacterium]